MAASEREPASRLIDSVRESSALFFELLGTRIALLSHEIDVELARARASAIMLIGALICLALALMLLVLLVVVVFWDTHRLAAIGWAGISLLGIAFGLARWSRQRLSEGPRPFAATLQELAADSAALRGEKKP